MPYFCPGKSATAAAVNSPKFLLQNPKSIATNEKFFYQFFQQKASLQGKSLIQEMTLARERAKKLQKKQNSPFADLEEDDEEEAFAQSLMEKMLQQNAGGIKADADVEEGIDFDYSSDEETPSPEDFQLGMSDEDELGFDMLDGSDVDSDDSSSPKRKRRDKPVFASAEEFEEMKRKRKKRK